MVNTQDPHRRYNPLTESWVLVSPHRTQRPWQGAQETPFTEKRPEYDPKCYLCPGNTRAGGLVNEKYEETFVFENDFAAVKPAALLGPAEEEAEGKDEVDQELFRAERVTGTCKVICFSPRHDLTLAQMTVPQLTAVVKTWQSVLASAATKPELAYCQIFENKGSAMGCSNPHPHGQAWMTSIVPEEPAHERHALAKYQAAHGGRSLLQDYVEKELAAKTRLVATTPGFVAVVPYWATWPFEVLVISTRSIPNLLALTPSEEQDLAQILQEVTVRYDNLFQTSFPYSMGIHQSLPGGGSECKSDHLHLHFYPPLLRSATVRKFLVGFEMLGMAQRDLTPEKAAEMLRNVSGSVHYLETLK